ncbi:MAG: YitT family protein [Bacilli bacterium]|nr:YitT family protein [Mycoplasmatota bacterium]MDY5993328.1 YitT family protein [Bacilli bacterium]MEE0014414.1 YitT family protein [Bacilli bacterium]
MDDVIGRIKKKKVGKRITMLVVSLFFSAIVYNLFLLPVNLVTGGAGGIATITNYVYGIDPALMILIVSITCALLSLMYLGPEVTAVTILASVLYPFFVKITEPLTDIIQMDYSDMFTITLFAGVLNGIANGIMYKTGYNNGGLPVISQILEKYCKIPIAKTSAVINITVVLIGGVFFGSTNVMYAIILIYLNSIIINKVLLGISNNKAFYIITSEEDQIKNYIIRTLGHSVTVFDVKGGFLNKKNKVVLTVVPSREYYRVTEGIKIIDKDAFFVVTDAYEVVGAK